MRVAIVDAWGCGTSWWLRLQGEGCDVAVWTDTSECPNGKVGENLVPKQGSYERLVAWAKEVPEETVVLFCQSKYGEKADALRKDGLYVVGGGSFGDLLEDDRSYGFDVAQAAGCEIPGYVEFKTLSDGISHFQRVQTGGVFKTDDYLEADATQVCTTSEQLVEYMKHLRDRYRDRVAFMVQELIGGEDSCDFDINRWWNGREFVGPYGLTLERKRFLNDELGPSTGCALNAMWWDEEPQFARDVHFEKFGPIFASMDAPPGIYAANFRVSDDDGKPYFLEWTPRLGYDSEPTAALLVESLSSFLWNVATGQGGTTISRELAYSVRLTAPPYPHETVDAHDEHTAQGIPLPHWLDDGDLYSPPFLAYQVALEKGEGLYLASPEGIIGCAAAVGGDIETMNEMVLEFIDELHADVSKLQARTDGARVLQEHAQKLDALGVDVHPALLKGVDDASSSSASA